MDRAILLAWLTLAGFIILADRAIFSFTGYSIIQASFEHSMIYAQLATGD